MGYRQLSFPENSVFLVTGGAGFIGSHLVEALLEKGCFVKVVDDLSTGFKENVELFAGHPRYTFVFGDVADPAVCADACIGVDYVLHQAAWGSVPRSMSMPLFYHKVNVDGTVNMLEAARTCGVKKFVFASSSSVYGDELHLPKTEGREGHLLSPYAATKRCGEEWVKLYHRCYGLDTYALRYFNVFGHRQNPNGAYAAVIPKFVRQLLTGEIPTIHGDGMQSRDFTYIDNVIEANFRACLAPSEAAGEAYNIACGDRIALLQVYDAVCRLLGVSVTPHFDDVRDGDIKHSHADISKAKTNLGYDPSVRFFEGLEKTIEWYCHHC